MTIKAVLYVISATLTLYALQSLNFEKFIKANMIVQARLLFLFLALSISYLTTNFLYDFFINTKII